MQIVEGYVCQRTANGEHQWCPKLVEKPTGWMTNSSCHIVGTMRGCTLGEELARVRQRKVSNRNRDGSAQDVECEAHAPTVACAMEVGETVEEEDVVTTATKGGQHKEVLDRITAQRLDLVGVEKARWEDMTYMRHLKVY